MAYLKIFWEISGQNQTKKSFLTDAFRPEFHIYRRNFSIGILDEIIEQQKPIAEELAAMFQKQLDEWLASKVK